MRNFTDSDYEQTQIYKDGLNFIEFGKLLANQNTTLRNLVDFGKNCDLELKILLRRKDDPLE